MTWYHTGMEKIEGNSVTIGLSYLDKAIAVFSESEDTRLLALARHHKLRGLKMEDRFEEVEREFAPIMEAYTRLQNHYGKALLLMHLAEALKAQGRWERANSYFNLAAVLAENFRFPEVMAHTLLQQALLWKERENHVQALEFFKRAERFAQSEEQARFLAKLRFLRGEVLFKMGEASEAAGVLEDAQSMQIKANRPQDALKSLDLLKRIYEHTGMTQDQERISRLIHLCGQQMLKRDSMPIDREAIGPPIEPAA